MSTSATWLHTLAIDAVEGTAQPGEYEWNGEDNRVAAIQFYDGGNQQVVVIEGRPEDLRKMAEQILTITGEILASTSADPELRALYGMPPLTSEVDQRSNDGPAGPWHDADNQDEIDEAIADYERGEYLLDPANAEPVFDPKED